MKSLETSAVSIARVTETVKDEMKKQVDGFLEALWAPLILIKLGILRVVFWGGRGTIRSTPQYQYDFKQLSKKQKIQLKYIKSEKNADMIFYKLTSWVSSEQDNVEKSKKLRKIEENG